MRTWARSIRVSSYLMMIASLGQAVYAEPLFMGLGDLPGGEIHSGAIAISADGSTMIGGSGSASGGEYVRWTAATGMVEIGDSPGWNPTFRAHDVSADGSVVVGLSDAASGYSPFRWSEAGGLLLLGDLGSQRYSSVGVATSADGAVLVGLSYSSRGGEAFRWTAAGGMVGLGDLVGNLPPYSFRSGARATSADGSVVVGRSRSVLGTDGEAFRWTQAGGMTGLGDIPGGRFYSDANDVSADGTVIVGTGSTAHGGEAFRWTAAGGMQGLGYIPGGGRHSSAKAVSADGSVVAGEGIANGQGPAAFVWDATNGMRELHQVLIDLGLDLDGWILHYVSGISDDGHTIVGTGRNPAGDWDAWIAVLETSTSDGVDAFQCFAAKPTKGSPKFIPRDVHLEDQFWQTDLTVKKVNRLCSPVDLDEGQLTNPEAHLTCYKLANSRVARGSKRPKRSKKWGPRDILVSNVLGEKQALTVKGPRSLCVPSTKEHADASELPGDASGLGIDPLLCYDVKLSIGEPSFSPLAVTLYDQFGESDRLLTKAKQLCAPVDKNSEGILDEETHLACYKVRKASDVDPIVNLKLDVLVTNSFGDDQAYRVKKPKIVCLPSTMEVID